MKILSLLGLLGGCCAERDAQSAKAPYWTSIKNVGQDITRLESKEAVCFMSSYYRNGGLACNWKEQK